MDATLAAKFASYPPPARQRLQQIRELILALAAEHQLGAVDESLKWGEPSYKVRSGSPVRMDWKAKDPDHTALYFICTTTLVETFREIYGDELNFEGKRAILLDLNQPLPEAPLRHCLELAMRYQQVKHLPLLGA